MLTEADILAMHEANGYQAYQAGIPKMTHITPLADAFNKGWDLASYEKKLAELERLLEDERREQQERDGDVAALFWSITDDNDRVDPQKLAEVLYDMGARA